MRMPKAGDVWLVNYPYITPGNMKKIRPAIIRQVDEDSNMIIVQKLTTKYHKGNREFRNSKMKKKTFVSKETVKIHEYNLIRYIGRE